MTPPFTRARLLHTMLRVRNLQRSIDFYVQRLGMQLLRRQDFEDGRFTLAFIGYGPECNTSVLELTHNWDVDTYALGTAFGHTAIGVDDVAAAVRHLAASGVRVTRPPGPLKGMPGEIIAFIEDPDGFRVELIERTSG